MDSRGFRRTIHKLSQDLRFGKRYESRRFAKRYNRGKLHEGVHGGLIKALESIARLDGVDVADIGCGTGQMARRLVGRVSAYHGFDVAPAMIDQARRSLQDPTLKAKVRQTLDLRHEPTARGQVMFEVADATGIPLPKESVDVIVYPWSLTSVVASCWAADWRSTLRQVVAEADRLLRSDGTVAVIETANYLGELPWGQIWHPMRREMLAFLESEYGFEAVWFANDWDFQTARNLRRYGELWFTRETLRQVLRAGRTKIEECAGIWWKRAPLSAGGSA